MEDLLKENENLKKAINAVNKAILLNNQKIQELETCIKDITKFLSECDDEDFFDPDPEIESEVNTNKKKY